MKAVNILHLFCREYSGCLVENRLEMVGCKWVVQGMDERRPVRKHFNVSKEMLIVWTGVLAV